jgi:hypothetical protein
MDEANDIHDTAHDWYQVKLAKGQTPRVVIGGQFDGLEYFAVEVSGCTYWLTESGLLDPPGDDVS